MNEISEGKKVLAIAVTGIALGYFVYDWLFGEGIVGSYWWFLFVLLIGGGIAHWIIRSFVLSWQLSLGLTAIVAGGVLLYLFHVTPEDAQGEGLLSYGQCKPDGYKATLVAHFYPVAFWSTHNHKIREQISETETRLFSKDQIEVIKEDIAGLDQLLASIRETKRDINRLKAEITDFTKRAHTAGFFDRGVISDDEPFFIGFMGDTFDDSNGDEIDWYAKNAKEAFLDLSMHYLNEPEKLEKVEILHLYWKKLYQLEKGAGMVSPYLDNPLDDLRALKKCHNEIQHRVQNLG